MAHTSELFDLRMRPRPNGHSPTLLRLLRKISLLLACGILSAAGCDSGQSSQAAAAVRIDTIGTIVRVSNPPAEPVEARLLTSIGSSASGGPPTPFEFGRVTSAILDAEGNVLVADAQAREVRVFAPDGAFLRSFGGPGDGPGELASLNSLAWAGDRLLALDHARISIFSTDGDFIERWPWYPITGPSDFVRFYPAGPEEAYVLGLRSGRDPSLVFIRLTEAGARDTLVIPSPAEATTVVLVCPRPDQGISFFEIPFGPQNIISPAPDDRVIKAWSADYQVAITTPEGDTLRIIERAQEPLGVSDAEWAEATGDFEAFQNDFPGVRCDPVRMERPAYKAAIQGVYFTHEGDMVVEVTADAGTRYDLFDTSGVAKGAVTTPARDRRVVPFFRDGRVVQVVLDDLEVQHVQLFEFAVEGL